MRAKKILVMLMVTMLLSTGVLAENQEVKVMIDGVQLQTDSPARIVNSSTLVPLRAIFETLGSEVYWENSTKTVTGIKNNDKILLQIGNPKASLNGKEIILDSPPIIVSSRTLVPVRFIAESLGSNVDWDSKTRTVIIENKDKTQNTAQDKSNPIEFEILELVNIERAKVGLPALKMNEQLSKIARMKSNDMADGNYFSHTSPTYGSSFDMMKQFGINYNEAGENIAKGYSGSKGVMNGWMNSESHKENILDYDFKALGVGYVNKNGINYWTQMFTD